MASIGEPADGGAASVEPAKKRLVVTLVHGTWGRGFIPGDSNLSSGAWPTRFPFKYLARASSPLWFKPEAEFVRGLQTMTQCEVREFCWSGANSVLARYRAARQLQALIAADPPDVKSVIIAHSHGGNVALKAAWNLERKASSMHIVTLATPFVRVIPRWWNPSFIEAFLPMLLTIGVLVAHQFGGWAQRHIQFFSAGPLRLIDFVMIVLVLGFPAMLISVFLTRFVFNPGPVRGHIAEDKSFFVWRPFRLAQAANYVSDSQFGPKLLVLRGVDDEASLVLAFGSIGARLSHAVRNLLQKKIFAAAIILWPLLVYAFGSSRMQFVSVAIPAVALLLMLLPGFFYSVFGREFAFGSVRCEIASNSAPDSSRAKVVTPAQWDTDVLGGLRHSLYDHPECVPQIVLWLGEEGVIDDLETKTRAWMWDMGRRMEEVRRESGDGDLVATREGGDDLDKLREKLSWSVRGFAAGLKIEIPDEGPPIVEELRPKSSVQVAPDDASSKPSNPS
jgi:hypothetical protein